MIAAAMPRRSILAMVVVAGCLAGGCVRNPATGRDQLNLLAPGQAKTMGDAAMPEMIAEYGGEVGSVALRAYVDRVGRAVARHTEPQFARVAWTFTVLNSGVVNAFALPGGHVFVTRGLLERFSNEAQVAAALGHEIGHITGGHVEERISQTLLARGILAGLGSATDSQLAVLGADLFASGYLLHFNREQESEADRLGVGYMVKAAYDPAGMVEVLEILAREAAGPRPPEILSTHPDPARRIRDVKALLAGPYRGTQGNPAYQLHAERFRAEAAPALRRQPAGRPRRRRPFPGRQGVVGGPTMARMAMATAARAAPERG